MRVTIQRAEPLTILSEVWICSFAVLSVVAAIFCFRGETHRVLWALLLFTAITAYVINRVHTPVIATPSIWESTTVPASEPVCGLYDNVYDDLGIPEGGVMR